MRSYKIQEKKINKLKQNLIKTRRLIMNPLLYILILRDYLIELLNIKDNIKG